MHRLTLVTIIIVVFSLWAPPANANPWMSPLFFVAANAGEQAEPALAYNSNRGEFLAVWHEEVSGVLQIVGQRLDKNGQLIGSQLQISDAAVAQLEPDVVYDRVRDRYLVVWTHDYSGNFTDTDLAGRFVPWDGVDAGYQVFGIYGAASGQWTPEVALSPGADEYLVVWTEVAAGVTSSIRAQRWSAGDSGAIGSAFTVASSSDLNRTNPAITWNPESSQYLVAYQRRSTGGAGDIYASRLSWSGGVIGSEIGVAGWSAEEQQVDVAACRGTYMVVWTGGDGTNTKIYARPVDEAGTAGAITNVSGVQIDHRRPAVACNDAGNEYMVAWQIRFSNGLDGVGGGNLGIDGALRDSYNIMGVTASETLNRTRPALAVGDSGIAACIWEIDRAGLVSRDIEGRLVSVRLFADGFETGDLGAWTSSVGD